MAKKLLLFVGLLSLFVWNVEARKRSPLRLENDTILHVCSNLSDMDYIAFGVSDEFCDALTVSKDLMANLLLAAGDRGGICTGGGGASGEPTNRDGTKKKTGW